MRLTRTAGPTEAVITLSEAKVQCHVDHGDEDAYIETLIAAASDYLDGPSGILGRAIIEQTWLLELEAWPDMVVLPIEPVTSVVVSWLDRDGEEKTFPDTGYDVISNPSARPVLQIKRDVNAPQLGPQKYPVRITIVAGWADASEVPASLKVAMLMLIAHWYERGASHAGDLPMAVSALLARWRVVL